MPRLNGLDAAACVREGPEIVFLTAFDQYAVAAFEQRAADYLLKPVQAHRLIETVSRLRERLNGGRVAGYLERLAQAIEQPTEPANRYPELIKAGSGRTVHMLVVKEVLAFRAVPGYTEVLALQGRHLLTTPLRELIAQLDPKVFVRIHRNAIVNLQAVALARRLPDGRYAVELRGSGEILETRRSQARLFHA